MATTTNTTPTDLEFIGHVINDKISEQPKGKKVANTLTALFGAVISIAATALTLPVSLPDWVYLVIIAVTTLGTALGVKTTKNGFSDSQVQKLRDWQAEYIDQRHIHDDTVDAVTGTDEGDGAGRHRSNGAIDASKVNAEALTDMVERWRKNLGGVV